MRWSPIIPPLLVWLSAIAVTIADFVHVQRMTYIFDLSESIGLLAVLIGFSVRKVAKRTLGYHFQNGVSVLRRHKLVKHGIYGYVRHPMYLGAIFLVLGTFLLLSVYGFVVMLGFIPCILYRIHVEEKMLLKEFGKEYRGYMRKTKRMLPFFY